MGMGIRGIDWWLPNYLPIFIHTPPHAILAAAVLEEALFEEFGLRPVSGFEIEHTHKLGNPLLAYTNYPPKHFGRASWEEGN